VFVSSSYFILDNIGTDDELNDNSFSGGLSPMDFDGQ
jgi:hypothetical protein